MKAVGKSIRLSAQRSFFARVAWLVIFALLSHSVDNCAAHLGEFAKLAPTQISVPCADGTGPCDACAPAEAPHSDGCDLLSEVAVLTSSQHQIEHLSVALTATVAVIPATPQVIALSGCLHNRAQAPPASFAAVFLRSSLSSRAPPVSA